VLETEPQIIEQYIAPGKVRLIYRHLVQLGDESVRLGEASECAGDQGKFWEMRKLLYSRQGDVYAAGDLNAALNSFARELGLDAGAFAACLQSGKHRAAVLADARAAEAAGVRSRPVFDIGDQRVVGALPFAAFQQRLDAALGTSGK
jgi:protein-disulfide isomerase